MFSDDSVDKSCPVRHFPSPELGMARISSAGLELRYRVERALRVVVVLLLLFHSRV